MDLPFNTLCSVIVPNHTKVNIMRLCQRIKELHETDVPAIGKAGTIKLKL